MVRRMLTVAESAEGSRHAVESGEDGLLSAGSRAPAGRYVRADVAWRRVLTLEHEDWLPASLDGRVALYRRLPSVPIARGSGDR